MRYLLDTHTLLWWFHEPELLSPRVLEEIGNSESEVYASAVSTMEISTKHRNRKLEYKTALAGQFEAQIAIEGFIPLSITCQHAEWAGNLASPHKDPWDRLLAAQARMEGLTLATIDKFFGDIGIETFW